MHHLMMNLPVFGTLGVVALLAGPLASLSIAAGAWVLERSLYTGARVLERGLHDCRNIRGWFHGRCLGTRAVSARQAA